MALAVCAAVRRQFSLPLEDVGHLYQWLTGRRKDSVQDLVGGLAEEKLEAMESNPKIAALLNLTGAERSATLSDKAKSVLYREYLNAKLNVLSTRPMVRAYTLAAIGYTVYLLTDLHGSPMILTEEQLVRWLAQRNLSKPSILCPLNPILNEVLTKADKSRLELDKFAPSFWSLWQKLNERPDLTAQERKVLALIRERAYQKVTVTVKGGDVIYADSETEEQVQEEQAARILDVLNSKAYETMTVHVRDGKVIQLGRKSRQKLSAVTG